MSYHPLDPLTADEITTASACFRTELLRRGLKSVKSVYVTLLEPPKAEVIAYLGLATHPTDFQPKSSGVKPARRAEAAIIDNLTGETYELTCTLKGSNASIDTVEKLAKGLQPNITLEELVECEEVVKNDPEVIRLCAEVGVKQNEIMCDGWSIGYEHRFGEGIRLQQAFIYARKGPDEHLYAHPLDFNCVVDTTNRKVLQIDFAPHKTIPGDDKTLSGTTAPHPVGNDSLKRANRARIPPPMESHDYLPDLIKRKAAEEGKEWDLRKDVKPLHVSQPKGVSFTMDGNRLRWQNWDMHIGFNTREGIVLNTIQYYDAIEKRMRPLVYRASFAEMVVPYAAPEWPHPRKFAFDVGEYGIGMLANSLTLGCDCLGSIHYLDGMLSKHSGAPLPLPRAVCIHEEDDGLLWKHTDFRPGGRAYSVRSRKLIIQMISTVANYEYLFAWTFKQDGTMALEIKLTGILNIYTLDPKEKCEAFGTQVAPQLQAHHHQHMFNLRIDPMIDGVNNSLVETEVHSIEAPTGSDENWAGNGFYASKKILEHTGEGARNYDPSTTRTWTFVNEDKKHYSSGISAGYKIMCNYFTRLYAKPDSLVSRRAPFATKHMWITPYKDGQLYPAGKWVTQTPYAPEDSLEGWQKGMKNIRNADIVGWFTFGVTHLVRPEDWPVMPYEHCEFIMKPTNFFKSNPSLDVPSGTDPISISAFGDSGAGGCCAQPNKL